MCWACTCVYILIPWEKLSFWHYMPKWALVHGFVYLTVYFNCLYQLGFGIHQGKMSVCWSCLSMLSSRYTRFTASLRLFITDKVYKDINLDFILKSLCIRIEIQRIDDLCRRVVTKKRLKSL